MLLRDSWVMKFQFKDLLAMIFITIYGVILWMSIKNPSWQDAVITARVQDIVLVIITHYFFKGDKKNQK